MADFLTHIILADEVLKKIESRRIYEDISKNPSLYFLGAQGPDPLFFYDFFTRKSNSSIKGLGEIMHRQETGAFLLKGFKRLQNVSYDKSWTNLAVYLCGFICHFTLDRMVHPYVYWATEKWIWGVDGTPKKTTHQQLEMAFDVIYWKKIKNRPAHKEKTRLLVDIGKVWPVGVESYLRDSLLEVYRIEIPKNELNKILKYFYRGHDLLYDPRCWKNALISWMESFTGGGINPPKTPYPDFSDNTIDWTNRKKRTWVNPFVQEQENNASVDEIIEAAIYTSAVHINTIFARIYNGESIENLFPNLSYNSGLEVLDKV